MDACDAVIVGGGPAGSSCAWGLRNSGLRVVMLERQKFPRDKVCGGWITPQVLDELELDAAEYARQNTLQPICGFRTGLIGDSPIETRYDTPVSYGIRRSEFDRYLVERSGVPLRDGEALTALEREDGGGWIVNGELRTRIVIGAGGHFCPVARSVKAGFGSESVIAAQEIEFLMDPGQRSRCRVEPEIPELYFCRDMKGYGWCFRKGDYLNLGLGRLDRSGLSAHVAAFLETLREAGRIPANITGEAAGHAYLLYGMSDRPLSGEAYLLVGDAAGLAFPLSGEGILPAILSGLLAARTILEARGRYTAAELSRYGTLLRERLGGAGRSGFERFLGFLPLGIKALLWRRLLASHRQTRRLLLERWFLHRGSYAGPNRAGIPVSAPANSGIESCTAHNPSSRFQHQNGQK